MKTHRLWLFILFTLLISCGQGFIQKNKPKPENKLEKYFEKYVVRTQPILQIDSDNHEKSTTSYFIGYDSLNRTVNHRNSQFYEYDSLGRISKEYLCVISRDPTCIKPHIFFYEYDDGNLARIKHLNNFMNDSIPSVKETFEYDSKNRLIQHIKYLTDTLTYTYLGDGTCKHSELETYWVNDMNGNSVRVVKKTIYDYDSFGRKTSQTWSSSPDGLSGKKYFFYDSNNRLVMEKDTSLDNYNREPYSCCILHWTNYKYDSNNRLVEEEYSTGSYDNPNPKFQRSTKYQY